MAKQWWHELTSGETGTKILLSEGDRSIYLPLSLMDNNLLLRGLTESVKLLMHPETGELYFPFLWLYESSDAEQRRKLDVARERILRNVTCACDRN